eukprot:TRINITY_DN11278_c0_g1_i1.p1 TRINITY_DN11278_c0_g1~~TRINITY_DN11278_c0_g1_i1.p1  ORF type:complete len:310 (+),score=24.49 TRINITY_DN11278_c0_g1_i1:56-985(+)
MHIPIYIVKSEIVPLIKQKPDGKQTYPWLNETTVDAIVLCKDPAGPERERNTVYLGSSFNKRTLVGLSDEYMDRYRSLLHAHGSLVFIYNVGDLHWVMAHMQLSLDDGSASGPPSPPLSSSSSTTPLASPRSSSPPHPSLLYAHLGLRGTLTIYDPMSSSSLDGALLSFAARLLRKEDELEKVSGGPISALAEKKLSVRSQLNKMSLSFFRLVNVGIQLLEEEGYNCGMYCALWARGLCTDESIPGVMLGRKHIELPKYTRKDILEQRGVWHKKLGYRPLFYFMDSDLEPSSEDVVVTKLLDEMHVCID